MSRILLVTGLVSGFVFALSACGGNSADTTADHSRSGVVVETDAAVKPQPVKTVPALASIKDELLTQEMIDQSIQLKLYDLDWARYELRRAALAKHIEQRLAKGDVQPGDIDILIEPPMPPRLTLEQNEQAQPSRGASDAPVSIAVFCSYQSSHCARMQSVYQQLEEHYSGLLRFVYYDFPQSFHRYARSAGNAARCANQLGNFWPYHQGVLAKYNELNESLYPNLARQVNLPEEAFSQCLSDQTFLPQIADNTQLAETLGFKSVPVTLVNGLYINGPKTFDTLRFFVDQELQRLGVDPSAMFAGNDTDSANKGEKALQQSQLPLRLESAVSSSDPAQASALIRQLESDQLVQYRLDDELQPGVFVVMIEAERVIIENNGDLEFLPLMHGMTDTADSSPDQNEDEELVAVDQSPLADMPEQAESVQGPPPGSEYDPEIMAGAEYKQRGIVAAKGETPLSRQWLESQLQNQMQLAEKFQPAELEVEGVHVLKLNGVEDNDFYKTLGLKEGDVVLRVNDEWVHEAQNNLFSKLESESQVSVVLMRKGLPVHYRYAIN